MNQTQLPYRAPAGRPRAIPPCDVTAPVWRETTTTAPADGRPVREPGEPRGRYAALVGHWMDRQDPAKKVARLAKMKATSRKRFLRRKRKEAAKTLAAQRAAQNTAERWYTPRELNEITGWSPRHIRTLAADWPRRPSQRPVRNSNRETEMFGDPAALPSKRLPPALCTPQELSQPNIIVAPDLVPVPRPSLWQRIKGWFA